MCPGLLRYVFFCLFNNPPFSDNICLFKHMCVILNSESLATLKSWFGRGGVVALLFCGCVQGGLQKHTRDLEAIISSTAADMKGPDRERANYKEVAKTSSHEAALHLSGRGVLQRSCEGISQCFSWPHVCPAVALASGGLEGLSAADSSSARQLAAKWTERHLGIQPGRSLACKAKSQRVCQYPTGCVCRGWQAKFYKKLRTCLSAAHPETLKNAGVVMCLDRLGVPPENTPSSSSVPEDKQRCWLHVSYLCLKPWRCTLIELEEVVPVASEAVGNPPSHVLVQPLLAEGVPVISTLQSYVNRLEPVYLYEATLYSLSYTEAPVAVLSGRAQISKAQPESTNRVWRGSGVEMARRAQIVRRHAPQPLVASVRQQSRGLFGDAESEDDDSSTDVEVQHDDGQDLIAAACAQNSEIERGRPQGRASASSSSSSSSSSRAPSPSPPEDMSLPDVANAAQPAAAITRHVHPGTIRDWHSFRFTWVPAKTNRQIGGGGGGAWQCICPYHKKATTGTKCKKTLTAASSSPESIATALLTMKAWAVGAKLHRTYRDHMSMAPTLALHETEEWLSAEAATLFREREGVRVLRDDQLHLLDNQELGLSAAAKAKARPGR